MQAFVLFVPRDVARLMVLGAQQKIKNISRVSVISAVTSNLAFNLVSRRIVTIMFMDIAGFSTIAENISAEHLVGMLTAYLEVVCGIIVTSQGTLDKVWCTCDHNSQVNPRRILLAIHYYKL